MNQSFFDILKAAVPVGEFVTKMGMVVKDHIHLFFKFAVFHTDQILLFSVYAENLKKLKKCLHFKKMCCIITTVVKKYD